MDQALAAADLAGFPARRAEARARGRYRGLGHAVYIEQSGFPPDEFAELRFDPSGTLTILMGTQSSGQGHQTAYTQLAAERLGVAPDKIRVLQGDTAAISFGRGTGGSRSIPVGGAALAEAADKLIAKGRRIAAHLFEAAEADVEFADGDSRLPGPTAGSASRRWRAPPSTRRGRRRGSSPALTRAAISRRRSRPSQWLPCLRGRDRARNRSYRDSEVSGGRRFRDRDQPVAARRPGAGRRRTRGRAGDARAHRFRPRDRAALDRLA